jgi:hypothetical protein
MLCDSWHGGSRRSAHSCALLKHDFDGGVKSAGGFGLRFDLDVRQNGYTYVTLGAAF